MNKISVVELKIENQQIRKIHKSYPKLPKSILKSKKTVDDSGHTTSVLSGYSRRVNNWKRKQNPDIYKQQ